MKQQIRVDQVEQTKVETQLNYYKQAPTFYSTAAQLKSDNGHK